MAQNRHNYQKFKERVLARLNNSPELIFTYQDDHIVWNNHLYTKEKLLGSGGYGFVYKYRYTTESSQSESKKSAPQCPEFVVVKQERISQDNYFHEAYAFANSAIVSYDLLGFGAFAGSIDDISQPHYVLMPYVEGDQQTSTSYCCTTPTEVLDETIQLLKQLQLYEDKKYVHSDIKSFNTIKTGEGLTLVDFDLSRQVGEAVVNFQVNHEASPHIAPEIGPGTPANFSQDIYSVGYFMKLKLQCNFCFFLLDNKQKDKIKSLNLGMLEKKPEKRIDRKAALASLQEIQKAPISYCWCCTFKKNPAAEPLLKKKPDSTKLIMDRKL